MAGVCVGGAEESAKSIDIVCTITPNNNNNHYALAACVSVQNPLTAVAPGRKRDGITIH